MARERDSQRKKFYAAVNDIAKHDVPLVTMHDVQLFFATKITSDAHLKKQHGSALETLWYPIHLMDGRGYGVSNVCLDGDKIHLPKNSRTALHLLRCVAYHLHYRLSHKAQRRLGCNTRFTPASEQYLRSDDHAFHGWQFCSIFLELVTRCLGKHAGKDLVLSFKNHNVRYKPKVTKVVSLDRKQAMIAQGKRLADIRMRKKFQQEHEGAELDSNYEFETYYETLYKVWKPR